MSGIAAILRFDGRPVDRGVLAAVTRAASRRGPDGEWLWLDGPVGLGHRELCATEGGVPERGRSTTTDDLRITFDGRLDERDELTEAMRAEGVDARGRSDADLVVEAYRIWGRESVARLLGDFAFVLWDGPRRTLVCARDAVGVKPLYYHVDRHRIVVASEPRQILRDRDVEVRPNLALLGRYLSDDYTEREQTLYEGIRRLKPAHVLTFTAEGSTASRYWDVDPGHRILYRDDAEYDEHFRDLLRRAVAARLRSAGPVGALLSGGLDSSAIVCTAREVLDRGQAEVSGLETWSMVFEGFPCDERGYIRAVTERTRFPANFVHFSVPGPAADLEGCRDQPDVRYSPITRALMPALAEARDRGVRVMLSGTGGDEFLAPGFHHLTDLLLSGRLPTFVRQLRADAEISGAGVAWLCREFCVKPLVPGLLRRPVRRLLRRLDPKRGPDWLAPGFAERFGLDDDARERARPRFRSHARRFLYDVLHYNSNLTYAVGENDQLASMHSMEYRYPFLDRRLVEFLIAIPERHRWWMDRPKTILRRALRDVLPEEVRERRDKAVFAVVFDRAIQGRMAPQIDALIRDSVLGRMGVIDPARLERRFADLVAGRADPGSRWAVFNFIGLEIWSRAMLGRAPDEGVA